MKALVVVALLVAVSAAIEVDAGSCPPCNAGECIVAQCKAGAPYACLEGSSGGGCAAKASDWNTTGCSLCCNTDACRPSVPTPAPTPKPAGPAPGFKCPPCSSLECSVSSCTPTDAFMCVSGASRGKCATTANMWENPQTCTSCCDASACKRPTGKCHPCSKHQCDTFKCPWGEDFVCTSGQSRGGCSASPDPWSIKKECSSCCDMSACGGCRECSASECSSAKRCPFVRPYMCTAGNATGGCSASAAYWPNQKKFCTSCCDVISCNKPCTATCTPAQCAMQDCQKDTPFMCTSGPMMKECSAAPGFFPSQPNCQACCDTNSCRKH